MAEKRWFARKTGYRRKGANCVDSRNLALHLSVEMYEWRQAWQNIVRFAVIENRIADSAVVLLANLINQPRIRLVLNRPQCDEVDLIVMH